MHKFFPSTRNRVSTRRLIVVAVLVLLALAWVAYSFLNNDPQWENYLVAFAFIALIVAFNIADSFWPVVSIDSRTVTQHRSFWFGGRHRREDADCLSEDAQFLYLGEPDAQRAIDLGKLDDGDREVVRQLIESNGQASAK